MGEPPARGANATDPYTLLCERCGYVVDGLPLEGPCPECGLPIARSLPGNRPGTAWQQRPGLGPMLRTCWAALRHPVRTLDTMAVAPPPIGPLLMLAGLPFGMLLGLGLLLILESDRWASKPFAGGGSPGSPIVALGVGVVLGLVLTPVAAAALAGLTWVEARGLVIFGAQRGGRVDPALAHTIVRHGAAGWLVASIGALMVLPLAWSLEPQVSAVIAHPKDGAPRTWTIVLAAAGVPVAVTGFLAFEFFAWLGLRRCKFANRPPPQPGGSEPHAPA